MHNILGKKSYFDLVGKCSSLHEPVRNGPEAVTISVAFLSKGWLLYTGLNMLQ